jgi:signal transduction histidine kinase/ActR/RegA family two-component response regulator
MNRLVALAVEALGTKLVDEIELDERVQHVRSTATICIACSVAFSTFNIAAPDTRMLGFAEALSMLLFFVPAALLVNRPQHIDVAESLLLLGALCISSALIILGGIEGTGLFWVYSVPFLAFFIKGQRRGWYYSLAFFACHMTCLMLPAPLLPFAYPYSAVVRTHFLLSMGFYVLIAAAFNHARSRFEMALHQRKNEAEAASLAKSRFLAAASHDLRQPAHALGLFVARLKQLPNSPQTRELVAGVDASVQALQEMLDAFFDYSRLDAQLTHARLRSFALNTVFDKLRTSFSDMAHHKGLRLRIRPTTAWVQSDPVLLHRILLNLLSNAVQHTHSGSVLLTCRPCAVRGLLLIQVCDSGKGIAPEHQQKVFEEFYQVENPERDRNKGLGLGLSIVERSCKLLDHRITLRSALGCGSTFALQVPQGQVEMAAHQVPIHEDLPLENDIQGMRVLLIEDDELGRAALQGLLQSWGCSVLDAASAQAALAHWNPALPPDFILTDYRLLGAQNGVDAVHELRALAGRDIPACILSGDTDASARQRITQAGLPLLQKPVRPAKLRSILRHAVSAAQGRLHLPQPKASELQG